MGATVIELTSSSNVAQPGAMHIRSCRQVSDVWAARHGIKWTLIANTRSENQPSCFEDDGHGALVDERA